jgi:hypothetical protein
MTEKDRQVKERAAGCAVLPAAQGASLGTRARRPADAAGHALGTAATLGGACRAHSDSSRRTSSAAAEGAMPAAQARELECFAASASAVVYRQRVANAATLAEKAAELPLAPGRAPSADPAAHDGRCGPPGGSARPRCSAPRAEAAGPAAPGAAAQACAAPQRERLEALYGNAESALQAALAAGRAGCTAGSAPAAEQCTAAAAKTGSRGGGSQPAATRCGAGALGAAGDGGGGGGEHTADACASGSGRSGPSSALEGPAVRPPAAACGGGAGAAGAAAAACVALGALAGAPVTAALLRDTGLGRRAQGLAKRAAASGDAALAAAAKAVVAAWRRQVLQEQQDGVG